MADNNISNIMDVTMEKVRTLVDSDTIIGNPITVDNVTIIPVSKVSFGLASGGSDFPSKTVNAKMFGGGGGAGASVTPICFLVVKDGDVKVLNTTSVASPIEKAISAVPEIIDTVTGLFKKDKED
ncbi:MAG: GerW family sporulation protein [Clostridia bacterium]|nr:GerW family sporulation protein [Clostridia bacterium]